MEKLIFATNNQHKVDEIRPLINDLFELQSLKEAGIHIDIPEPHDTLEANASEKCKIIYQLTEQNCFSEDSGLEVEALNGAPGVRSARYAGEDKSAHDNMNKLLTDLYNNTHRKARFRTIIALMLNDKEMQFEGVCEGSILTSPRGEKGFGYDPIFIPKGATKTFGEMSLQEKIKYSHRSKATAQLLVYLSLHGKK